MIEVTEDSIRTARAYCPAARAPRASATEAGLYLLSVEHPTLGRFLVLGMGTQHVKGSLLNGRYLRLSKFLENAADEIRHDI